MKFKSATFKDFRCFTDLTVQDVPETARLMILAGPNGSGKSSFFDGLYLWNRRTSGRSYPADTEYYNKSTLQKDPGLTNKQTEVIFHDYTPSGQTKGNIIYIRSAYRNEPEFQTTQLKRAGPLLNENRISRMIENDSVVSKNYQRVAGEIIQSASYFSNKATTTGAPPEQMITIIRDSFCKLFPDIKLCGLGNPTINGTFLFTKGINQEFPFKNLSGGEKAAFDLILDLIVVRNEYDDTVFCIDEPESHMNARLQANLLLVLYDLIPKNCQLMLATHSISMMRQARDIETEQPGSVAFLDFGDLNFNKPQTIRPTKPNRTFWKRAHDVALYDLATLVAPSRVVICEGHPRTNRPVGNHSHDAQCYNTIFKDEFPDTQFVSMGNDREVSEDKRGLAETLHLLISELKIVQLIDRDDRSNDEISEWERKGVRVLSRRNLESYLLDDNVMRALAISVDKKDKAEELLQAKQSIQAARPNDAPDNLKPASGKIYNECKRILGLTQCGNTTEAFMRDTLAPLVKPGMGVYEELKHDIFG